MRLMPASMIQLAREAATQRARTGGDILAAYLTGSLLENDPFLGETADIDLVLVHNGEPKNRREIVAISPDIHLDIKHNPRGEYSQPRELRIHPWLGPEAYDPLILYEQDHFFQFIQAGLRNKFHEPANTIQRARRNAEHARQIWSGMKSATEDGTKLVMKYLKAVNHAANAVAVLNGRPLAERRFLLQFPVRADAAGQPGLAAELLGLLGAPSVDEAFLSSLLPEWERDFLEASTRSNVDGRIHPARLAYYKQAIKAMLEDAIPYAIIWPFIHTWSLAATVLPSERLGTLKNAFQELGLFGGVLVERLRGLDSFLNNIEGLLDSLSSYNGV